MMPAPRKPPSSGERTLPSSDSQLACSPTAYLGGAGTGKTTSLVAAVVERHGAAEGVVLGLTFMHGSRRRLTARLIDSCAGTQLKVQCDTIDAFCLQLVRRFRRLVGLDSMPIHPIDAPIEMEDPTALAATYLTFIEIRLLAESIIRSPSAQGWLLNSYTCVVVDEFQDCSDDLFGVMKALAGCLPAFAAADEFQLLDQAGSCEAVEWLRRTGHVVELVHVHRTSNASLLAAATALRSGVPASTGLRVIECRAPGLAAWEIAQRIAWQGWGASKDLSLALLSPVGAVKSAFFSSTLRSLQHQLGTKRKVGPYPFRLESAVDDSEATSSVLASIKDLPCCVPVSTIPPELQAQPCVARLLALCRVRGQIMVHKTELVQAVSRSQQVQRFSVWRGERGRAAMTVHGAKNREFDYVVLLWPYEVTGSADYGRRLMYNGITRAKRDAIVLVQGVGRIGSSPDVLGLL